MKRDFFKKFRRKKKENEKSFTAVTKKNLEIFLEEITKSVDANFSGQESNKLEKYFEQELNTWLKETILAGKPLNPKAIKLGVVLGLKEALRKINEAEEKTSVTYIS